MSLHPCAPDSTQACSMPHLWMYQHSLFVYQFSFEYFNVVCVYTRTRAVYVEARTYRYIYIYYVYIYIFILIYVHICGICVNGQHLCILRLNPQSGGCSHLYIYKHSVCAMHASMCVYMYVHIFQVYADTGVRPGRTMRGSFHKRPERRIDAMALKTAPLLRP